MSRQPSLVAWDDKLLFYRRVMEEVDTTARQMDAQSIRSVARPDGRLYVDDVLTFSRYDL